MAQQVQVSITDDIDGSANAEPVVFAFGRTTYEIDLSKKNRTAFEKAMANYIEHARRVSGGQSRGRVASPSRKRRQPGEPQPADVRAWAREAGIDLSTRGRIPDEVMQQYVSAH